VLIWSTGQIVHAARDADAGNESAKRVRVATQQRQFQNLTALHNLTSYRRLRVEDRGLTLYYELLVNGPEFHAKIEEQLLPHLELDAHPRHLLEACALDLYGIFSRQERGSSVDALGIGFYDASGARGGLPDRNPDTRNGRAGGIGHDPGDLSCLRPQCRHGRCLCGCDPEDAANSRRKLSA